MTKRQIAKLKKLVSMAQDLLASAEANPTLPASQARRSGRPVRHRRTAAEAEKMRNDILAKRAKGVSALSLAKKYNVSTAYIYMIK
ncbi:MAG: hypothetical protein U1F47_07010 [Hyphomicrobiales bacterium]